MRPGGGASFHRVLPDPVGQKLRPGMNALRKCGAAAASAVLVMVLSNVGPALAQTGKDLYTAKGCPACHGADGNKPLQPTYPKLAGQPAPYLVLQLKAFKAQERKDGQAALMWGMAGQLTEAEMGKIAEYLSKLP
jgi:cytochrome c